MTRLSVPTTLAFWHVCCGSPIFDRSDSRDFLPEILHPHPWIMRNLALFPPCPDRIQVFSYYPRSLDLPVLLVCSPRMLTVLLKGRVTCPVSFVPSCQVPFPRASRFSFSIPMTLTSVPLQTKGKDLPCSFPLT